VTEAPPPATGVRKGIYAHSTNRKGMGRRVPSLRPSVTSRRPHRMRPAQPEEEPSFTSSWVDHHMYVLCLAGEETTATVLRVAAAAQLAVRVVSTTAEALRLLREQEQEQEQTGAQRRGCFALVAALGVEPSNFLFNEGYGDRSDLVALAKRLDCNVVVYSHTAVRDGDMYRACMDVGADAVVAAAADLQQQLTISAASNAIEAADLRLSMPGQSGVAPCPLLASASTEPADPAAPAAARAWALPTLPPGVADNRAELSCYPPLLQREHRDEELLSLLGSEQHQAATVIRAQTESISRMLADLPRPLLAPSAEAAGSGQEFARIVAISDTHSYHDNMHLPLGDVLIHAGDIVGNYGEGYDIVGDLRSFVAWLQGIAPSYKHVVFIAGNHDTLLDRGCQHPQHEEMRRMLASELPPNVTYLENESCDVMNGRLRVWGSPVTECRRESMGKRFYSNAFERPRAERARLYATVPDDGSVDIIVTHGPPAALSPWGDEILKNRMDSMSHPPPFHVFGHDHDHFGVYSEAAGRTIAFNAAQEGLRRADRRGGGQAWIFDAPLR